MTAETSEGLKDILKSNRVRLGLTQKQLGEKLGVLRATVSMYERGKIYPSWFILRKICETFDLDAEAYLSLRGHDKTRS